MDAWHLLLESPWQFDRRTKHDGYKNTNSFVKDSVNIMLSPSRGPWMNLLSRTEFIKEVKGLKTACALVVFEEKEQHTTFPHEVQSLLK